MSHKCAQWVFGRDVKGAEAAPGVTRKVLAYSDEMMSVANVFEKGAAVPMHSHPHTQIAYIVEGKFDFTVGDETKLVQKGDALLCQNSEPHSCVCLEAGVVLDVFTPMREDFL